MADAVRELPEGAEQLLAHFMDAMLAAPTKAGDASSAVALLSAVGDGVLHRLATLENKAAASQLLLQHAAYFPREQARKVLAWLLDLD